MSLIERRDERKAEAEALANKFNAEVEEINKLKQEVQQRENDNAQVYADFQLKNAQYAELEGMVKEEEGVSIDTEVTTEE
jgi:nicotinamide riboside kinase|tara:strand:- start:840 stop:1079 length:240 start_codon:yes stop_codon:yes gene_type:complete